MISKKVTTELSIGEDIFFGATPEGETSAYGELSRESRSDLLNSYVSNHKQPWHRVAMEAETLFKKDLGNKSIYTKEGIMEMFKSGSDILPRFVQTVKNGLFKGDETWGRAYANTLTTSLKTLSSEDSIMSNFSDVKNYLNYSMEGIGAMATYQNRDNFNGILAFGIGGWFARSPILNAYFPIEENGSPVINYKYTLEYAIAPKTDEMIPLPQGYRDGSLDGMFDQEEILCLYVDETTTPEVMDNETSVEVLDRDKSNPRKGILEYKSESLGDGFIKINKQANLLILSSSDSNNITTDDALEPTVAIAKILYISGYKESGEPIYKIASKEIKCQPAAGEQRKMIFRNAITFNNITVMQAGQKVEVSSYTENIFGEINIDTGVYTVGSIPTDNNISSVIVATKPYARITDGPNRRYGLEIEVNRYVMQLNIEYTSTAHIPLTPFILDNWAMNNETLPYVAVMTDKLTEAYQQIRDLKLEKHLRNDMEKLPADYDLYDKLGGFYTEIEHDAALTGPITSSDPYEQNRFALKKRILDALSKSEQELMIPDTVAKQWIFFGPSDKISVLPNIQILNNDPEKADDPRPNSIGKFGFGYGTSGSFIDGLGRNVIVHAISDKRWNDKNIMGVCKSTDISYPTTIYMPYLFRIFTGIDARYTNRQAILFMGRDNEFTMTQAHAQIMLSSVNDNLYENTIASARERVIVTNKA